MKASGLILLILIPQQYIRIIHTLVFKVGIFRNFSIISTTEYRVETPYLLGIVPVDISTTCGIESLLISKLFRIL